MADDYVLYDTEFVAPWRSEAACYGADQDLFFPTRGGDVSEAKRICATCGVRDECLDFALDNYVKFGIWGGLSENERRAVRSQRHRERLTNATTDTGDRSPDLAQDPA